MRNLIPYPRRTGKIVGLSLVLSLSVGMFAGSTAALAVNPQDSVRRLLRHAPDDNEERPSSRAERSLCESGPGCRPGLRRLLDGPTGHRSVLGNAPSCSAAAAGRRVPALYRGDLRRPVRQLFGAAVAGHRRTALQHRCYCPNQNWRISDVYLDGTISQVAIQRSEFYSILRREGVDGLVMALNRKVDLLGKGLAKSS
jgi:hypothetical protein